MTKKEGLKSRKDRHSNSILHNYNNKLITMGREISKTDLITWKKAGK
jgi:hypothetical protein